MKAGKKPASMPGGDVGFQLLYHFGEGGVFFHFLFHLTDGVDDGRVVPIVKELADVILREVRHGPDEIHGNLPGLHCGAYPLLAFDDGEMVQIREDWQDRMIAIQAGAFNKMSRSIVRMMDDIQKNADIQTKLLDEQLKNEQYVHRLEQADFLNLQYSGDASAKRY